MPAAAGGELLLVGIGQLVDPGPGGPSDPLDVLEDAWLSIRDGRIAGRGSMRELPAADGAPRLDARGAVVLPGFVDSHTHLVFGGTREREYEARLAGATYAEIAAGGGGIGWSVRDLRARGGEELLALARRRLRAFARWGTTTVEAKSGYGLTLESELASLEVVRRLAGEPDLPRLVPTFLGAHAVPPEYAADRDAYVALVVETMLPAVASERLAEFCDVFCDEGAFTLAESAAILGRAKELGFGIKIHAEEFVATGGAALAASLGAASADHLVAIDAAGIAALAEAGTVATLLPATSLFLRLPRHAPARAILDGGATIALATDFNPGTSPTANLPLVVALGCSLLGLSIPESVRAATAGGARALGRSDRGTLADGALGDVALFDVPDWRHLAYGPGGDPALATLRGGRPIWVRGDLAEADPEWRRAAAGPYS